MHLPHLSGNCGVLSSMRDWSLDPRESKLSCRGKLEWAMKRSDELEFQRSFMARILLKDSATWRIETGFFRVSSSQLSSGSVPQPRITAQLYQRITTIMWGPLSLPRCGNLRNCIVPQPPTSARCAIVRWTFLTTSAASISDSVSAWTDFVHATPTSIPRTTRFDSIQTAVSHRPSLLSLPIEAKPQHRSSPNIHF